MCGGRFLFIKMLVWIVFIPALTLNAQISGNASSLNSHEIMERMDSLMNLDIFEGAAGKTDQPSANTVNEDSVPVYPDMFYEFKLEKLNRLTPIDLFFNEDVKKYIDIFLVERRNQMARVIGLSELYFPLFEENLDRAGLPLELKYLPIVESGLNPLARSSSGAVGLWQFLLNAGKMFDLEINSYIDQRSDPHLSTMAACRYLNYLYSIFGDWQLVLAAYNGGPGVVRNAIERSGGKTTYLALRDYLPEQTRNYVPAFIAVNYVMNYYNLHNIHPVKADFTFNDIDTVMIHHSLSLDQVAAGLDISFDEIRFLNPAYKTGYIPEADSPVVLVLPKNKIAKFLSQQNILASAKPDEHDYFTMLDNAGSTANRIKIIHTVQAGEFFHKIAMQYNCTMENIKAWNHLTENNLFPGQKLDIWVTPEEYRKITSQKIADHSADAKKN
jgi:membrane-bound lytic murein transglycosylase D